MYMGGRWCTAMTRERGGGEAGVCQRVHERATERSL